MVIIENQKDYDIFLQYWNRERSIIVPILVDVDKHTMYNSISFLYIRFENEQTDNDVVVMDYVLPFDHNDCKSPDFEIDLSTSFQPKKVFDKKSLLQLNLGISEMYDIQTEEYFNNKNRISTKDVTEDLTRFYQSKGLVDNLGKSIPITRYVEKLREFTNDITYSVSSSWINSTMIPTLSKLETRGIRINNGKFIMKWPSSKKHINWDIVYTDYNIYTSTSRPSNSHGGVNYAALNKKDGSREIFIPRENTIFLQFDYDAYHVRIIGKMINYELPKTSVHQWLADIYGTDYKESKGITFKILYGGIPDELKEIEFFKKTDEFIQNMWKQSQENGFITTKMGRKIFLSEIEDVNAQKLFNYFLQATETEYNIEVISKLQSTGIESMVLYVYDSFLFEYDIHGTTEEAKQIKSILESNGFPVKASWGDDYSKV